jgi:hypothetical protein
MSSPSDLNPSGLYLWHRVPSNDDDHPTFARRLGPTEISFYYDGCFSGIVSFPFALRWGLAICFSESRH